MVLDLEDLVARRPGRGIDPRRQRPGGGAEDRGGRPRSGTNLRMRGDRRALKQIMLNLLSNAVKFTPRRRPHHGARAHAPAPPITFSVADTGIGIPRRR